MSTTTAADLLVRAHHLAIVLRDSHDPITLDQWEQFDVTLHRALHEVIGADASRVDRRDPQHRSLLSAIHGYPNPLRPPADIPLTPVQAAQVLGVSRRTVYNRVRSGRLAVVRDAESIAVHARDLDQRPDITPADPTDAHPLARLSVTLGVFADQLNTSRTTPSPVLDEPGEITATSQHLLAIGRLAAGRALTAMPYADANRPVAVAQYCEHVLDTLAGPTAYPASLERLRSVAPEPSLGELGDRLEAVLDRWARAARADLTRAIPAMTGTRLLGNQAIHLYAVTHQLMYSDPDLGLDPDGATASALSAAAHAAKAADPLWSGVTTFARPTLEYATASRELFVLLDDVTAALQAPDLGGLDARRALADLGHATAIVAEIMAVTRDLPERLARAQILHIPKGRTTLPDLNSHRRLATKPATIYEVESLARAWSGAGFAAHTTTTRISRDLDTGFGHSLRELAPVERTL